MQKPQVSINSQTGVMAKKIKKRGKLGGVKGGWGELGGVSEWEVNWGDAGVPEGGPRENPRSISSPKLELLPKN